MTESLPYALLALGREILISEVDSDDAKAVNETLRHAVLDTYFFRPGREAIVSELAARADEYRVVAEDWLSLSKLNWEEAVPPQAWVSRAGQPPRADAMRPASGYWGNAVWRPLTGGLWTSTVVDGSTPWLQDLTTGDGRIWTLEVDPNLRPRVFEIETADDWLSLVTAYPHQADVAPTVAASVVELPKAPLYLPDWPSVAQDWDAIHFTRAGKLRSLYVVARLADGFTLVHGEEALEETLWLRWLFDRRAPMSN